MPRRKIDSKGSARRTLDPLRQGQADVNRSTAESWVSFAPHRRRVTELILAQRIPPGARAAILGAGNCNDLDLPQIAASFAAVDLVDLDPEALARGIHAQSMQSSPRLFPRGNVDLSGILTRLAELPQKPDRHAELEKLLELATCIPALGNETSYDLVVSTCVLTQMISSAVTALGQPEPLLPLLALTMRKTHFGLLCRLVAPHGTVVFISDLVSSDSCPALLDPPKGGLPLLMETVVRQRNFFTGLNPYAIVGMLDGTVDELCLHEPWLWQLGDWRAALVYALTFQRR